MKSDLPIKSDVSVLECVEPKCPGTKDDVEATYVGVTTRSRKEKLSVKESLTPVV